VNVPEVTQKMKDDIAWCGITVDRWTDQSSMHRRVWELLEKFGYQKQGVLHYAWSHAYSPETKNPNNFYPFVADYTAEKVVQDFLEGVNLLIRGEDLLTEFSLYNYFCKLWDLPIPRQVFLPRLLSPDNGLRTSISKTMGGWGIYDSFRRDNQREYAYADDLLRRSCLIDPRSNWAISNIKQEPYLEI
jgi:glutamyl/glutaminyl-tRNA synthetase